MQPNIELTTEYYADYLKKIQKQLSNPYSPLGRHHKNLNGFIRSGLADLAPGARVLDAGCGLSQWVNPEIRQRHHVIGVDVQPDSIKACQEIYKGCDYRLADLYALEFKDDEFDAVVMREVIEHFRTPEKAVKEVYRVLKPGGVYVLTTPNYDSLLLHFIEHTYNRFFGGPCKPYLDDVHPSKFRVKTLRDLLSKYFRIERYGTLDYGINLTCVARKT